MMCSFDILCFAFAGVFSAKSKSSFSVVQVRPQVPQHLKSGNQSSHQSTPAPLLALTQSSSNRPGIGCLATTGLPRKEVIQPHLPVRLPCYDFTPITDPTLDACLPKGLAQRLQV